jgi:tetratricopeptide (TPR) repeat protein
LKVLSAQGDGPVYLAALSGTNGLWVIKTMPLQGPGAVDLGPLKEEAKRLSRMRSQGLAEVLCVADVESDGGFVMEYVPGKSLAAICQRADEYSVLLPRELGLVVAHDIFEAAEFFHAFEGTRRVHGNISLRTILVSYSGEVKVAGYRPGCNLPATADAHVERDLRALANLLCDLRFEMFPKELANVVPRLLESHLLPVEATAAVRAFLHDHGPSVGERRKVADWLKDLFLGQREEEAQQEARLLAAAIPLLARTSVRPVAKRMSMVGGTTALLALLAGGGLLMAHRRPGTAHSEAMPPERQLPPNPDAFPTVEIAAPETAPPAPATPELVAPTRPAPETVRRSKASDKTEVDSDNHEPDESQVDRLLRAADAAFGAGKRIEAVHLGIQAVRAGGGVRAHLALGEYYRSMHRYQEALTHYRSAVEIEPDNNLALTGLKMLEKKLTPCQ